MVAKQQIFTSNLTTWGLANTSLARTIINGHTEGDISSGILHFNMFNGCYLAEGDCVMANGQTEGNAKKHIS